MSSTIGTNQVNPFLQLQAVQAMVNGQAKPVNEAALQAELDVDSVERGSSSAVAQQQATLRQQEFAKDLQGNPELVAALKDLGLNPTAEGLARVFSAAKNSPELFTALVNSSTAAVLTMGKSEGANAELSRTMGDFVENSGVRRTDSADMAYMMARIMLSCDTTEREASLKAMNAALDIAKQELSRLESQRDNAIKDSGGKLDPSGEIAKSSTADTVAKFEAAGKPIPPIFDDACKAQAAKNNVQKLDVRIDALRDTIKTLTDQIAKQQTGNRDLVNEVILQMLAKAMSVAQQGLAMNPAGNQAAQGAGQATAAVGG